MPPADSASRAGVMPKASGDPSSRTFAKNMTEPRNEARKYLKTDFPNLTIEHHEYFKGGDDIFRGCRFICKRQNPDSFYL